MTSTDAPAGQGSHRDAVTDTGETRRRTRQRDAIVTYLGDQEAFRTAQEIHAGLREADERVGLATVYRTLQTMAADGELDVLRSEAGEVQYRRCELRQHHHHLVCRQCGHTVEVLDEPVARWADEVALRHGFRDVEHHVEVFGRCPDC